MDKIKECNKCENSAHSRVCNYSKNRYSQVSPLNAFAIYDNTLDNNLLYFVRWYDSNSIDDDEVKEATGAGKGSCKGANCSYLINELLKKYKENDSF